MLLPRQWQVGGQQRESRLHHRPRHRDRLLQGRGIIPLIDVRLLESTADTQPQLQPALLRLSAMISVYFTHSGFTAAFPRRVFGKRDHCAKGPEWMLRYS